MNTLTPPKGNRMAKTPIKKSDSSAHLGVESKLWLTADKLRNNIDTTDLVGSMVGLRSQLLVGVVKTSFRTN